MSRNCTVHDLRCLFSYLTPFHFFSDIVPKIDDPADQMQRIECTADPSTAFLWCHMPKQTLCEIMVTCGSENRLAFCECHKVYGYDKPSVLDGMEDKFDELCVNSATTLSLS